MHAKRFSSIKHNTQGFAGDASSLCFCKDAFAEDGSAFFISSMVAVGTRVFASVEFDSVDDVVISTSLPSDGLVDDDPETACSRA
jgi:hypothetical protein